MGQAHDPYDPRMEEDAGMRGLTDKSLWSEPASGAVLMGEVQGLWGCHYHPVKWERHVRVPQLLGPLPAEGCLSGSRVWAFRMLSLQLCHVPPVWPRPGSLILSGKVEIGRIK